MIIMLESASEVLDYLGHAENPFPIRGEIIHKTMLRLRDTRAVVAV
jgi:hypothetical protein